FTIARKPKNRLTTSQSPIIIISIIKHNPNPRPRPNWLSVNRTANRCGQMFSNAM
ncbi:hypothetical protein M5D96_013572, partial [Drosophila gunungcola]